MSEEDWNLIEDPSAQEAASPAASGSLSPAAEAQPVPSPSIAPANDADFNPVKPDKEEKKEEESKPPVATASRPPEHAHNQVQLPRMVDGRLVDVPAEEKQDEEMTKAAAAEAGRQTQWTPKELQQLFLYESKMQQHVDALQFARDDYLRELDTLVQRQVSSTFSTATKARILASLMIRGEKARVDSLLSHDEDSPSPMALGVGEVVKALQLLDAPRKGRQLKRKLQKLEEKQKNDAKSVRRRTLARLRTDVHNLLAEPHPGSVSGARQRRVLKWIEGFTAEELEFYLLSFPVDSWRALADIVHPSPKSFKLPYFLPVVFGKPAPEDSVFALGQTLTRATLADALTKCPRLCNFYSFIRKKVKDNSPEKERRKNAIEEVMSMGFDEHAARVGLERNRWVVNDAVNWIFDNDRAIRNAPKRRAGDDDDLDRKSKTILAEKAPLQVVLWWWEELKCRTAENKVLARLEGREPIEGKLNYGKLMERLLLFRSMKAKFAPALLPYAEERLGTISVPGVRTDKISVAVLGDASGSMDVAIRSATIIGSLLSAVLRADLVFFNGRAFAPPVVPRTASEAVQVVESVKAAGGTSMAAALWPYYEQKKSVDLFVLVSDEGENSKCNGYNFHELFQEYRRTINPLATVYLVSFLRVGEEGLIKKRLDSVGIDARQFRLDPSRPDTSKFDALLGCIALECSMFSDRWNVMEQCTRQRGLPESLTDIIMSF